MLSNYNFLRVLPQKAHFSAICHSIFDCHGPVNVRNRVKYRLPLRNQPENNHKTFATQPSDRLTSFRRTYAEDETI